MTDPIERTGTWPTRADTTGVGERGPVLHAPPPPYTPPPPDRRIGLGMLLGLAALLLAAAGIAAAWYLGHRGPSSAVTTIVSTVASPAPQATPATTPATGPATRPATTTATAPATTDATAASANAPAATVTATAPAEPQTATVPDVAAQREPEAAQALWRAGLVPSFVFVPSGTALGTVVAQARSAGATVPYRSHVQINLSQGRNGASSELVPNVAGRSLQDAVATLNASGLRLIFVKEPVDSRAQVGTIVGQTPTAGSRAPRHAQVLVVLGVLRTG